MSTWKRRLIVLRHAKSSWKTETSSDHARPLNARGRGDAPRIGLELAALGWKPDLVICSESARTRETWTRMRASFGAEEPSVLYLPELYHADVDTFVDAVCDIDDRHKTVAVIGHNPGSEAVVQWLSGESIRFTTCNAALFEGDVEHWARFDDASMWALDRLIRPKELD